MFRVKYFLLFILLTGSAIPSFADSTLPTLQNAKVVYLSGNEYTFAFTNMPDSATSDLFLQHENHKIPLVLKAGPKRITQKIKLPASGHWKIVNAAGQTIQKIWAVPGWFSLLPPLLAIILALLTRQVLVSLFAGIYIGTFIIYGYNPIESFFLALSEYIAKSPANPDNMAILIFSLTLGGMVGVVSKSGGTQGIVEKLSHYASDSRKGQIVTWAMGILIFFDDYANTLIVGNTMRPLTDKLKISREKLSYLVDATAAPIATIAVISTWIGYQLSLIAHAFTSMGLHENAYLTFIKAIPYASYPILTLLFGLFIAYTARDFGPMLLAERRAKHEGKVIADDATPLADTSNAEIDPKAGSPLRWYNAFIPVAVVVLTTLIGIYITGSNATKDLGPNVGFVHHISAVFGNGDPFRTLIWGAFLGSFVAIILAISQRILTLHESISSWVGGVKSMVMAALILTMAWAIGNICRDVQTAEYVIHVTSGLISAHWVPALTFVIAGVIAFSTGSSWATMAILTPIVIPMAHALPLADATIPLAEKSVILLSSIAAILAGATFGDHCSPISDTTIMSSMASGSDHIDHVRTQMPYALVVAGASLVFGFIPAGFGLSGGYELFIAAAVLFLLVRFYGKKA